MIFGIMRLSGGMTFVRVICFLIRIFFSCSGFVELIQSFARQDSGSGVIEAYLSGQLASFSALTLLVGSSDL